jgi:hypothetical protein
VFVTRDGGVREGAYFVMLEHTMVYTDMVRA